MKLRPQSTKPLDREAHTRRVEALTRLIESPGWEHIATRLRARQAEIVAQVMSPATPPADVPALRSLHTELGHILAMPEGDRAISQREIDKPSGK